MEELKLEGKIFSTYAYKSQFNPGKQKNQYEQW